MTRRDVAAIATTGPVTLRLVLTRCDECRWPVYALPDEPEVLCRWCRERLVVDVHGGGR